MSSFHEQMQKTEDTGGILVLFALMIALIISMISYSLYMGRQVENRIMMQNASDTAALATTNHATQGLNMISANNLTIGASLHVAASVPIVASYASAAYAMTTSDTDLGREIASFFVDEIFKYVPVMNRLEILSRYQKDVWNKLAIIPYVYMSVASGTTAFNQYITDYWMYFAPFRAVEVARLNAPGSVAMAFQQSALVDDPTNLLLMQYKGTAQTTADQSLCQTLKSSRKISDKDSAESFVSWLVAPLLTADGVPEKFAKTLDGATKFINRVMPFYLTFTDCGWGMRAPLLGMLKKLVEATSSLSVSPKMIAAYKDALSDEEISGDEGERNGAVGGGILSRASITYPGCNDLYDDIFKPTKVVADAATRNKELSAAYSYERLLSNIKNEVASHDPEPNRALYVCHGVGSLFRNGFGSIFTDLKTCEAKSKEKYDADFAAWYPKRSPYECPQTVGETTQVMYDHMPHVDASGKQMCLNLRTLRPRCAYKDFLKASPGRCLNHINDLMNRFKNDHCGFMNTPEDPSKNEVFEIVNVSKQMRTYAKQGRIQQIGYQYIKDPAAFERSRKFLAVVGAPLRSESEVRSFGCPPEYQMESDGQRKCMMTYLPDFSDGKPSDVAGATKNVSKYVKETEAMQSGLNTLMADESQQLYSTWSRTQWVMTSMEAKKKTQPEAKMVLFWPDWYPATSASNMSFVSDVLKRYVKGDQKNRDAKMISALQ